MSPGTVRTDSAPTGPPAQAPAEVGAPAPAFALPDEHGVQCAVGDYLSGRGALVVFYPFAFSSICGGELQELREKLPVFQREAVNVVAVSCDPMYALRVYADRETFGFPLLSDFWPHGEAARAYGVFDEERGCARRGSFLVDAAGAIRWSVVNPIHEARPFQAYREALAHLDG